MKLGPGLSFSWKRALGVTKAKRRVSNWASSCRVVGGERNLVSGWDEVVRFTD